tara:strand:- start:178 stop:369 length:192 start_codon:yes stop_codon:yes gene_type:complete
MKESILLKVISWRICSISITLIVTWLWTGDIASASSITLFLHTVLITAHWIFENAWKKFMEAE